MNIIPVLDLQHGVVVRGVAGQREAYRPLQSRWTDSCEPGRVADAIREHFGLETFYVADLDAIEQRGDHLSHCRKLADAGFRIMLDSGIRVADDATAVLEADVARVIVGLESIRGPQVLQELINRHGPERITFSLDLQRGRPLGDLSAWPGPTPAHIAAAAVERGISHMIVLDLTRVGTERGLSTLPLCRHLLETHAGLTLVTGGGVKTLADLRSLQAAGVAGALVATALHNGTLTPASLPQPFQ